MLLRRHFWAAVITGCPVIASSYRSVKITGPPAAMALRYQGVLSTS